MKTLVAFYSRADENYFGGSYKNLTVGNTEKIANVIIQETKADQFKIEQKVPYAKDYNTCIDQAQKDQRNNARPELKEMLTSLDEYDEIYLGYPNYWGDLPMAVYTFLESFDWKGKTIHPFITHEGSGLAGTDKNIAKTCKGATVTKGLAIHGSAVDQAQEEVISWIDSFKK